MTQQVHAPYHFVPLSSWVYLPQWAHLVSHDYPFQEGLSGVIEYTLTNHTHLLVGGNTKKDPHNKKPTEVDWARDPQGRPIIPGTSIKGMLRSFLEIATFGKFSQVDDRHFGIRDLSKNSYYNDVMQNTDPQAAWLRFDEAIGQWKIRQCEFAPLFNDDLNRYANQIGKKSQIHNHATDRKLNTKQQDVQSKYNAWPLNQPPILFELVERSMKSTRGRTIRIKCARKLGEGSLQGRPVFVGRRVGPRHSQDTRLNFNYFFYNEAIEENIISNELVNKMFAAHDEKLVSFFKKNANKELGFPVFLRLHKNNRNIVALGFTKMPKLMHPLSITEMIENNQPQANQDQLFDFCELLFGCFRNEGYSIKSRVAFSDLTLTSSSASYSKENAILSSPKASYTNAYIEQPHQELDGSLLRSPKHYEQEARLAGWKRYPAQGRFRAHIPHALLKRTSIQSQLNFLKPSHTFSGRLVFHNLLPQELGALLWALSPATYFHHSLGHGKSLGAGAITFDTKLTIHMHSQPHSYDKEQLKQCFVEHMDQAFLAQKPNSSSWLKSPQIRHLLAFGDLADNSKKNLSYMPLNTPRDSNKISYTSSKKPSTYKALPHWQARNERLNREESINITEAAPKGRLQYLLASINKEAKE